MSKNNKASNYNEKMLTRLRIQFIVLSMAVVIIMQGFIVYTSIRNTYSKMVSKSDQLVSSIYINVLDKKPVKADARYFYIIFDKNNHPKTINVDNISDISEDEALAIYYEAYETGELDGFYNDYRYCIYEKEKRTIAIFVLRSNMIDDVKKTAVSLIEGSCVGIGIMLLVLIFASKLIVMPIAKAHRKQKEFITSASHELKTPITVIRADADILLMDDENNEWLADIKKQAENLTTMTNNLVTLARMDERNGNIPRIDFPVSELAEEVVHSYNALAMDFGKHFSYDIKPNLSCCGDAASVRQLFTILLDNAFKYSPDNGNINFILSSSGNYITLCVTNDVEHIDKGLTDRMFDRFYRADSTSARITGHGLGLSIAKAIVAEHNGSIKAKANGDHEIIIKAQLHIK